MPFLLANKLQKPPQIQLILDHYSTLHFFKHIPCQLSILVSIDTLQVPSQLLLPFPGIFYIFFLNGPVGSKATRQVVFTTLHKSMYWLAPVPLRTYWLRGQLCQGPEYLVSQNWRYARADLPNFMMASSTPYSRSQVFCQDITLSSLLIISVISTQLQLILLWKLYIHLKILLKKRIFCLFVFLAFILLSCLRFQSTLDEKERIYLFWWKCFTVN